MLQLKTLKMFGCPYRPLPFGFKYNFKSLHQKIHTNKIQIFSSTIHLVYNFKEKNNLTKNWNITYPILREIAVTNIKDI